MPPKPDSSAARLAERVGPFAQFLRMQAEVDEIIFALIAERRAAEADRDDVLAMLLDATPRGRLADESSRRSATS